MHAYIHTWRAFSGVFCLLQSLKEEREDWPQFKTKDEAKTFLVVSRMNSEQEEQSRAALLWCCFIM